MKSKHRYTSKRLFILIVALMFGLTFSGFAAPKGSTIVDVAIAANADDGAFPGVFDTLIAAVLAADPAVAATLAGNGQHTVFAPTDEAFAAIGIGVDPVEPGETPLVNPADLPQGVLSEILLYHVVKGRRDSTDITGSERIRTLLGDFLHQEGGFLTDNLGRTAEIIVTDVPAANGIIHAIDSVVLPYLP